MAVTMFMHSSHCPILILESQQLPVCTYALSSSYSVTASMCFCWYNLSRMLSHVKARSCGRTTVYRLPTQTPRKCQRASCCTLDALSAAATLAGHKQEKAHMHALFEAVWLHTAMVLQVHG